MNWLDFYLFRGFYQQNSRESLWILLTARDKKILSLIAKRKFFLT